AAALLALPVRAVLDAPERLVDLRDQLPLAVTDAQREVAAVLQRGPVGWIGEQLAALTHPVDRAQGLPQQLSTSLVSQFLEGAKFTLSHAASTRCGTLAPGVWARNDGVTDLPIAYLDTFSGISGDMTVGALLDLGLPIERVREAVDVLGLAGVEVWAERTERSAIAATKFQVRVHG